MTFAELLTEVYAITAREDLVALTKSAVKAATLKAHQTDFYSKDIYETSIVFTIEDYYQSLDIISVVSNYRAIKYIRRVDTTTDEPNNFFTVMTPEEVLDEWGRERTEVCYVAGRIIEIKSSVEFNKVIFGCYVNPIITEVGYSSWVADLQPYAIIHEAARVVFGTIAQQAEASAQKAFVAEQYAELKIHNVSDYGY